MKIIKDFLVFFRNLVWELTDYLRYLVSKANQRDTILKRLETDGVMVFPEFFSEQFCDECISNINAEVKRNKNVWSDDLGSDHRIFGFEHLSVPAMQFSIDSKINSFSKEYLGYNSKASFVLGAKLVYKPNNAGSGGGWHRDNAIVRQFKAIVYLNDVGLKNGPFEYIIGSHKFLFKLRQIIRKSPFYETRFNNGSLIVKKNENSINSIVGKKGTLILVDTKGIHRGRPIECGDRYALTKYLWQSEIPHHIRKMLVSNGESHEI